MTKYVLNSGGFGDKPELSKRFFAEVVKNLGPHPNVLICCFAQPREDWEEKFAEEEKYLPQLMPKGVSPVLELAFPQIFKTQIAHSDAIYIKGGDDHLLQYWLRKFDIPTIWEGKVVGTNSASSHAMAKHFWTCDWRQCMDGLNVLPLKFLSHYKSSYGAEDPRGPVDWEKALDELKKYGDKNIPIYALKEGHYKVIEK